MLVKWFLTSNETIVFSVKLWFGILKIKVKASGLLVGCCLRFARYCFLKKSQEMDKFIINLIVDSIDFNNSIE